MSEPWEENAQAHADTRDRLTRIETKLDGLIDIKKDHETRIRSVERKQWGLAGAASAIGVVAAPVLKALGFGGN